MYLTVSRNIKQLFRYVLGGFFDESDAENALKKYLIYTSSVALFLVFFFLGFMSIPYADYTLSIVFLGSALFFLINFWYLKITDDDSYAATIIMYTLMALTGYLVYSGGYQNSGHLWIYVLPPIALFIRGLKKGLIDLGIFLLIIGIMLFYMKGYFLDTYYPNTYKIGMISSFILLTLVTALYTYSREKSTKKMEKVHKDLEFFLRRDPLTGLYNRRGYNDSIDGITEKHGVMLMCDIDYFKNINDTYGHEAGDYVIQEVARCIRNTLRKEDVAIRWGGEEFLIFLSDVNINNGYLVAEKLRESVERMTIYYQDIALQVTVSMGISLINDKAPLEEAIRHADNAMYVSKKSGRNKTSKYKVNLS